MQKVIIVDSMVWSYSYSESEYFHDTKVILNKLIHDDYKLAINLVIEHELKRTHVKDHVEHFGKIINWAYKISVNASTFDYASELFRVFKMLFSKVKDSPKLYLGDILIASSAFLNDCYILTENLKDFPAPLFDVVASYPLISKVKEGDEIKSKFSKTKVIFRLRPNSEFLDKVLDGM